MKKMFILMISLLIFSVTSCLNEEEDEKTKFLNGYIENYSSGYSLENGSYLYRSNITTYDKTTETLVETYTACYFTVTFDKAEFVGTISNCSLFRSINTRISSINQGEEYLEIYYDDGIYREMYTSNNDKHIKGSDNISAATIKLNIDSSILNPKTFSNIDVIVDTDNRRAITITKSLSNVTNLELEARITLGFENFTNHYIGYYYEFGGLRAEYFSVSYDEKNPYANDFYKCDTYLEKTSLLGVDITSLFTEEILEDVITICI